MVSITNFSKLCITSTPAVLNDASSSNGLWGSGFLNELRPEIVLRGGLRGLFKPSMAPYSDFPIYVLKKVGSSGLR